MNFLKSALLVVVGILLGVIGAIKIFIASSTSERHALYHAYRLGCKEGGSRRLSDCGVRAAEYQLSMEMLAVQMGLQ